MESKLGVRASSSLSERRDSATINSPQLSLACRCTSSRWRRRRRTWGRGTDAARMARVQGIALMAGGGAAPPKAMVGRITALPESRELRASKSSLGCRCVRAFTHAPYVCTLCICMCMRTRMLHAAVVVMFLLMLYMCVYMCAPHTRGCASKLFGLQVTVVHAAHAHGHVQYTRTRERRAHTRMETYMHARAHMLHARTHISHAHAEYTQSAIGTRRLSVHVSFVQGTVDQLRGDVTKIQGQYGEIVQLLHRVVANRGTGSAPAASELALAWSSGSLGLDC